MPHIGIVEQTIGERNFKERKGRHRTGRSSGVHQPRVTNHCSRLDHGFVLRQLRPQAPLQLLAEFRNLHSRHHDELTRQHFPRIIVIWQLAGHTAILAILVPAESPVRNCFRADELEAPQQRIALRHLKLIAQQRDLDKFFVRTERFRHDSSPVSAGECAAGRNFPGIARMVV